MKLLFIGGLGVGELVLILVIVLIIFGAGKLPQIGDALGRGIRNFKKASSGQEDIEVKASAPPGHELPAGDASQDEPVLDAEEVEKANPS
jgi:sec-independent protein translocase protein TatA